MARRVAGEEGEELAAEVMQWIEGHLGAAYQWPGNYGELEQCVKNVLIRRNYRPSRITGGSPVEDFLADVRAGRLTADDLLAQYVTIVYSRSGSYEQTARQLQLDRRTVKTRLRRDLLAKITANTIAN